MSNPMTNHTSKHSKKRENGYEIIINELLPQATKPKTRWVNETSIIQESTSLFSNNSKKKILTGVK